MFMFIYYSLLTHETRPKTRGRQEDWKELHINITSCFVPFLTARLAVIWPREDFMRVCSIILVVFHHLESSGSESTAEVSFPHRGVALGLSIGASACLCPCLCKEINQMNNGT